MLFKNISKIIVVAFLFASCNNKNESVGSLDDLVINEICGDADQEWVELLNRSDAALNIGGVKIFVNRELLYAVPANTSVPANSYKVFEKKEGALTGAIPLDQSLVLFLVSPANDTIDIFDRDKSIGKNKLHPLNGSYARIPDGRSFWEITRCPTKGAKNNDEKNCDSRDFTGLLINEVCAKATEEWIEVYNSNPHAMDVGGVTIAYKDEDNKEITLYKVPDNTVVNAKSYIVFDKIDGSLSGVFPMNRQIEFSLVSPKNEKIDIFDRDADIGVNKAHPPIDGSYARIPDGGKDWNITRSPTKGGENKNEDLRVFDGLVINEVCAKTGDEWIEAFNKTSSAMDISGITIKYKNSQNQESTLYKIPDYVTLAPNAYIVFDSNHGVSSGKLTDKPIELSLISPQNQVIDLFKSAEASGESEAHPQFRSYSRYPNGSATWVISVIQTKAAANRYATYADYMAKIEKTAIWMRGEHFRDATPAIFQNLANHGIGHLLVNEAAMTVYGMSDAAFKQRVAEAKAHGIKIHIWFQCFYSNSSWVNPIILDRCEYNQAYYNTLIQRAERYVRFGDIAGIHLDYIRYPGTSYLSNCNPPEITGENAITEFCSQISAAVKAIDKNVKLSAALMWETTSNAHYYGQNARKMAKPLDILMPMIYRYSYGTSAVDRGASWITNTARWFAGEVAASGEECEVWVGLLTYRPTAPNDTQIVWLTAEQLEIDCRYALNNGGIPTGTPTGATGIVLFRYGIVNYFNLLSVYF